MLGAFCQCCLAPEVAEQQDDIMRQPFPMIDPAQYTFKLDRSSASIHSVSSTGSSTKGAAEREKWKLEVKQFIAESASDEGLRNIEFYDRQTRQFVEATFRLDRDTNSCVFVSEADRLCDLELSSVCMIRCGTPDWFEGEADRCLSISFRPRSAKSRTELVLRFPSAESRQRFLVSMFVLVQIRKRAENNAFL